MIEHLQLVGIVYYCWFLPESNCLVLSPCDNCSVMYNIRRTKSGNWSF
jgi:hypothetical protein